MPLAPEISLDVSRHLAPDEVTAVRDLLGEVTEADGMSPLSEHVMLHLRYGGDPDARHLLARSSGNRLVGYAHIDVTDAVDGSAAELAVRPEARGQGVASAMVERLLEETPDGRLRLWAHGQHPAAAALARRLGFRRERVLWQMRRSLLAPLPAPALPEGITLRPFVPGQDERAWTEVNNRAFADHPDQGRWGIEEVRTREQEPWFDPAGFLLAEREADGAIVGFHWTKVHGGTGHGAGDHMHELIGEVYVVGVDPAAQGQGLGPALTLAGLRYLRGRGLAQAMLYVDESNTNAIRVYERLGFTRWDTDVSFARD
ncbi:MAG: mycothiol synthase [Actinomycetota bacterium]|nr:mycothiol synthase [Actinomycetota bacterium]